MLLDGALVTLQLAAAATLLGFVIGTLCAIGRNSSVRWLSALCAGYVEGIRNTPFLVQIFLVFFGLSSIGITMSAFSVAIIALTINVGAYTGEIMRAGFNSVHAGQWEAAECLGLSRAQVYWHVVLRPAVERVYPSLTSQFILLMLASSITSQISVAELTGNANYIQGVSFRPMETYITIGFMYFGLALVMRLGFWLLGLVIFPRRRRLGTPL
ncbi:MAG: amino acid ABC transporter permease [Comamonadaceae bacterium]|jgi:polar amino acid transport system permease protein|uniref:Amino acid ABC transporter permease n=1 Tax=Hydrogenophaga borbori TaxID=2294117 RepID=A0A372EE36_9BURK|nr:MULTISPECIES: amino acid ABC transporter permease [Hydrogenophaga]NCT98673.1 amino acid ABC transporter permease [Comamonadaceae bacterium]RFP76130.1 amino acid ABC transporter permease [Hydrogenophaga borbori]WQB85962.1 amino acid ABC transporter permease [Hydrogenophaga sp. SNF1]